MLDYSRLISDDNLKSGSDVMKYFVGCMADVWIDMYIDEVNYHGCITLQYYHQYAYIFDDTTDLLDQGYNDCGQPRVLGVFGVSHQGVEQKNRKIMRAHPNASLITSGINGVKYDNGHFMSHLSGGSIDLNLFPQRRDVNRGWGEWRRFRDMEKFVAKTPGTFAFARPIYRDLTLIPMELEFGYCDSNLRFTWEVFPNR